MVKSTADYASEIHDLSRDRGHTENLQVLGYVGKLAGVSMEEVAQGLMHLSRSAYEASTPEAPPGRPSSSSGSTPTTLPARSRTSTRCCPRSRARWAKVRTRPSARALDAVCWAERRAADPDAHEVRRRHRGGRKEAVALGIVLDEKTIEAGEELGDTLDRSTSPSRAWSTRSATPLLGRVRQMVEGWVRGSR
jgi:hypothetical protein